MDGANATRQDVASQLSCAGLNLRGDDVCYVAKACYFT